jgi:hypothetical protein
MVQTGGEVPERTSLVRLETLRTDSERELSSCARMLKRVLVPICLALALPALACDYPDEGNMPLHRALTRVRMLPETESWQRERREAGDVVQFRLLLEETVLLKKRCYWAVEALADGKLWRRFYVSPDGKRVLREKSGRTSGRFRFSYEGSPLDSVFFCQLSEAAALLAGYPRRLADVSARACEELDDVRALKLRYGGRLGLLKPGFRQTGQGGVPRIRLALARQAQAMQMDHRLVRHQEFPVDQILQLPDVAGPFVIQQP